MIFIKQILRMLSIFIIHMKLYTLLHKLGLHIYELQRIHTCIVRMTLPRLDPATNPEINNECHPMTHISKEYKIAGTLM